MEKSFEFAIVRINKADNSAAGAGFLIYKKHIMTCTHVIAYALGFTQKDLPSLYEDDPRLLNKEVSLVFAVIDPTKSFQAKIIKCYPLKSNQQIKDIAVLEIINDVDTLPEQDCPVSILSTKNCDLHQHKYDALGFPKDRSTGKLVEGKIMGVVPNSLIQIQGEYIVGGRIEPGFSGTAIWDRKLEAIVGMVTKEAPKSTEKIGFMKPTEILIKAWGDLAKHCRDDAISEFVQILKKYEADIKEYIDLQWACYQSIPFDQSLNLGNENIDSPHRLIGSLVKVEKSLDKQKALLSKCAGLILLQFQKKGIVNFPLINDLCKQLERWLKIHSKKDKKTLLNELKTKFFSKDKHENKDKHKNFLLVCFLEENDKISVRSWFLEKNRVINLELNESHGLKIKNCQNLKEQELEKLVVALKSKCISLSLNRKLDSIHYFLALKLLDNKNLSIDSLDLLEIEQDDPFDRRSGSHYDVAIRLNRSVLNPQKINLWKDKGEKLRKKLKNAEIKDIFQEIEYVNVKKLSGKLFSEDLFGIKLINAISKDDFKNIMEVFLHRGIPLSIWKRKSIENNHQTTLDDLCKGNCLDDVFQKIKECRQQGVDDKSHLGHYLSLLWDDPTILTPDLEKMYTMP